MCGVLRWNKDWNLSFHVVVSVKSEDRKQVVYEGDEVDSKDRIEDV